MIENRLPTPQGTPGKSRWWRNTDHRIEEREVRSETRLLLPHREQDNLLRREAPGAVRPELDSVIEASGGERPDRPIRYGSLKITNEEGLAIDLSKIPKGDVEPFVTALENAINAIAVEPVPSTSRRASWVRNGASRNQPRCC